jgi:hypothetical protein
VIGGVVYPPLPPDPNALPEPKKPDLAPPSAKAVNERFQKAVASAKKKYDEEVFKSADLARKDLVKIMETETKAGRLSTALAVRDYIEKLPEKPVPFVEEAKKIAEGKLTKKEWEEMEGGQIQVVQSTKAVHETHIVLGVGDAYLVAPNPTDLWAENRFPGAKQVNYLGTPAGVMRMSVAVVPVVKSKESKGEEKIMDGFVAEGEGKLVIKVKDTEHSDNAGSVHVKIFKIR